MRRRIRGMMTSGKQFSLDSCMDMVQGMLTSGQDPQDLPQMKEDEIEDLVGVSGGMETDIISDAVCES